MSATPLALAMNYRRCPKGIPSCTPFARIAPTVLLVIFAIFTTGTSSLENLMAIGSRTWCLLQTVQEASTAGAIGEAERRCSPSQVTIFIFYDAHNV